MTHAELVQRAGYWLRRSVNCAVVFEELNAAYGEVPDAIGWRDHGRLSFLIECKASRGDFLADRAKPHRQEGMGMGCYRYFMCPAGMIRPDELPPRWGLLYVHAKRVDVVHGRRPLVWDSAQQTFYHKPDREGELGLMSSALHRLRLDLGVVALHARARADAAGVRGSVSKYAATNMAEFIAEAWAESCNNPEPRPIAKQLGEIVRSVYEQRFGSKK